MTEAAVCLCVCVCLHVRVCFHPSLRSLRHRGILPVTPPLWGARPFPPLCHRFACSPLSHSRPPHTVCFYLSVKPAGCFLSFSSSALSVFLPLSLEAWKRIKCISDNICVNFNASQWAECTLHCSSIRVQLSDSMYAFNNTNQS